MKIFNHLHFRLLFLALLFPIFAAQQANLNTRHRDTEIPKELARKFKRDAARLALRVEANGEDPRFTDPFIPKENIDLIYNALASIYLNLEKGKSLEKCNIHTFPNPSIDHLVLIFNKNVAWARPLRDGLTETDNSTINDLLSRYRLVIEKYVNWTDSEDAITIRSKDPVNMAAIANQFSQIDGVTETDLGIPKILGNDIQFRSASNGVELDYILRFGSWSSGKGKSHTWKFKVSNAGKAEMTGEFGDDVPEWMRCDARQGLLANF